MSTTAPPLPQPVVDRTGLTPADFPESTLSAADLLPPQTTGPVKRKIKYIDQSLQWSLLVVVILLEVAILSGAVYLLYLELNTAAEDNLYRVHLDGQPTMFHVLATRAVEVMIGLLVVNFVCLFLAAAFWHWRVKLILQDLRALIFRARHLDFEDEPLDTHQHQVTDLGGQWLRLERARHRELEAQVNRLELLAQQDTPDPTAVHAVLQQALRLLPAKRSTAPEGNKPLDG